jgi:WD40 repeat protein
VLLVSGGFDHRVRVVSARTLKLLTTLTFHQKIVNKVEVEKGSKRGEVIVHSISEDGYYAQWTLLV